MNILRPLKDKVKKFDKQLPHDEVLHIPKHDIYSATMWPVRIIFFEFWLISPGLYGLEQFFLFSVFPGLFF